MSDVYPIDITLAYSALSYNGILHEPLILNSIKDREGNMIKNYSPISKEVSDERTTFIIRDMMKSVVDNGTGGSLRLRNSPHTMSPAVYALLQGKVAAALPDVLTVLDWDC